MAVRYRWRESRVGTGEGLPIDLGDLWPVFSDISLCLVLFLVFALIAQFLELSQVFREMKIKRAQESLWEELLRDQFFETLVNEGTLTEERKAGQQRFRFKGDLVFATGRPELNDTGLDILTRFAEFLTQSTDPKLLIEVEGHTDQMPILGGPTKDNWELSSLRALTVVRLFQDLSVEEPHRFSLAPERLSATGYGEHHPIESARESEINRRVEVRLNYAELE